MAVHVNLPTTMNGITTTPPNNLCRVLHQFPSYLVNAHASRIRLGKYNVITITIGINNNNFYQKKRSSENLNFFYERNLNICLQQYSYEKYSSVIAFGGFNTLNAICLCTIYNESKR